MKKKHLLAGLTAAMLLLSACGGNGGKDPENGGNPHGGGDAARTLTGEISNIKDFQFTVDDGNWAYVLPVEDGEPDLSAFSDGDQVTVTYTGELSDVDPFEGTILSVEPADADGEGAPPETPAEVPAEPAE